MRSASSSAGVPPVGFGSHSPASPPTSSTGSPSTRGRKSRQPQPPSLLAGLPLPAPVHGLNDLIVLVEFDATWVQARAESVFADVASKDFRRALSVLPRLLQSVRDLNFHLHQLEGQLNAGNGKGGRHDR